jgi:F0F1-type ATP synthase epsilon subunit
MQRDQNNMAVTTFTFSLRSPLETVFEGQVENVRLKTDLGMMEILPDHASLVGTILYSQVAVRHDGTEENFIIRQGSVSVDEQGVARITALNVEKESSLSVTSIEEYLVYINEQLTGERTLNDYQVKFLGEQRAALEESLKDIK